MRIAATSTFNVAADALLGHSVVECPHDHEVLLDRRNPVHLVVCKCADRISGVITQRKPIWLMPESGDAAIFALGR